ncbi:hypothetical protein CI102_12777 [Trichoderma harzianum]|uniref:Uncharacterized protein n=1 Tax=Trichoderma harzianum CBS 226.95 TaxID=983964 RepID=A0A2T4ART8_TRIHA|nr:hypothetical protein M431DRAFT_314519 [Trichoderma harzianum CBS 226.95]PKK44868.1 hypothetical protein CI102_12777 [Trichoderma harzianum]PTB59770.1 hypothetical protein M431DRAFT_314519 [Trichoderma harzianum CBS 226.95]
MVLSITDRVDVELTGELGLQLGRHSVCSYVMSNGRRASLLGSQNWHCSLRMEHRICYCEAKSFSFVSTTFASGISSRSFSRADTVACGQTSGSVVSCPRPAGPCLVSYLWHSLASPALVQVMSGAVLVLRTVHTPYHRIPASQPGQAFCLMAMWGQAESQGLGLGRRSSGFFSHGRPDSTIPPQKSRSSVPCAWRANGGIQRSTEPAG